MKKFLIIILLNSTLNMFGQNALVIPPTISGTTFNLNLQTGTHNFFTGPLTNTMGVNGNILAPTLIFEKDSVVNISVNNNLSDSTTMHWHGMHVSPENDGGPFTVIPPSTTWNPSFTVMDKAATYWYHPHLHMKTNEHVVKGIAGLIIVKDAEEAAINLPRTYGVDDFPMVLQTKAFDSNNQIDVESHEDSIFMINATIEPYLDVPAQVIRMRILNGSSNRTYLMGLSNSMAFDQIASDGGLLAAPVNLTRLRLGPGERAEILIDFGGMQNQTIDLVNYCEELPIGIYGAEFPAVNQWATLPGYGNNPLNFNNYTMLQINVVAPTSSPVTTIPSILASVVPLLEVNTDNYRTINFGTTNPGLNFLNGPFVFNGYSFKMDSINEYVKLNDIEVWTLNNNTQTHHPFHIHDVQFYVLDRDGNPPPLNEQGRKDVIVVAPFEVVRFIAQFSDFENDTIPYMYHCHMLPHEDGGMMGQFIVSSTVGVNELKSANNLSIYPNPVENSFNLEIEEDVLSISIYDLSGKLILRKLNPNKNVGVSTLVSGIYFVRIELDDKVLTMKMIKR